MSHNPATPNVRVGIGVFVIKDGKFIMLLRKGAHGAGSWSLPGGHLEFGESFEDTACREVLEETGMTITNVRFGAVTNDIFENEEKHYTTIWMISDWAGGEAYIAEPDKCTKQDWFTLDTLPEPLFHTWNQFIPSEFYESVQSQISRS
jgi:8-oxo-dGTP diphosphatase